MTFITHGFRVSVVSDVRERVETKGFCKEKYFNSNQKSRDVEDNWKLIKSFILQTIEENVPSKISKPRTYLPGITHQIRAMIRKRNKLHK